jgi:putative ABC transport system ATP-binding protein
MGERPLGLDIEALRWSRGGQVVLDIPRFTLVQGEAAVVVGPSGCGKTTLLSLIAGLLALQQGRITVDAFELATIARSGPRALDRFRARRLGLVPQQPLLFGMLSALDNLLLAQTLAGEPTDPASARELLGKVGLADLAARRPGELSRGQQQRVALARALVNRPCLILADEPTANLDDGHASQVLDLLQQRAGDLGAALLIATHDARVRDRFPHRLVLPGRSGAS